MQDASKLRTLLEEFIAAVEKKEQELVIGAINLHDANEHQKAAEKALAEREGAVKNREDAVGSVRAVAAERLAKLKTAEQNAEEALAKQREAVAEQKKAEDEREEMKAVLTGLLLENSNLKTRLKAERGTQDDPQPEEKKEEVKP
jgi:hypothetical protein